MGGALNSVLGGVSNLVSGALNVASAVFPPLGIATSLANMVTQGIGQAVNTAAQTLTQVAGMPKFIAQEIGDVVGKVLGQLLQPSDPGCDQHVHEQCGHDFQDFLSNFCNDVVKGTCDEMKGGSKGGGSWFEALAKALGKALDKQAKDVQDKANAVEGQNASDNPSGFTDLQSASQRMGFMMSAADQVIKALGEALATAARKQ